MLVEKLLPSAGIRESKPEQSLETEICINWFSV